MSRFLIGVALVALIGIAGARVAHAENYAATGIDITNAAAQVHVIAENRSDIALEIGLSSVPHMPTPHARVAGGRLIIDGGLNNHIYGCNSFNLFGPSPREQTVNIWGVGNVPQHSLPVLTLHVPRQLDLNAGGAIFGDVGASAGGHVSVNGCGKVAIGAASGALDIAQNGSGDLDVANVGGALRARLNGSGDVRVAGASAGVQAEVVGSGDLTVGPMAGALVARLDGSGDLRVMGGATGADLTLQGSGDVNVGAVSGSLRAHLDGSGDLGVASLAGGQADLLLEGSGGLTVNGGVADHLAARLDGSGDLRFRGRAQSLNADLGGSGDILVAEAGQARTINDHGSGDVRVGN